MRTHNWVKILTDWLFDWLINWLIVWLVWLIDSNFRHLPRNVRKIYSEIWLPDLDSENWLNSLLSIRLNLDVAKSPTERCAWIFSSWSRHQSSSSSVSMASLMLMVGCGCGCGGGAGWGWGAATIVVTGWLVAGWDAEDSEVESCEGKFGTEAIVVGGGGVTTSEIESRDTFDAALRMPWRGCAVDVPPEACWLIPMTPIDPELDMAPLLRRFSRDLQMKRDKRFMIVWFDWFYWSIVWIDYTIDWFWDLSL